jgi:hypothetical protein
MLSRMVEWPGCQRMRQFGGIRNSRTVNRARASRCHFLKSMPLSGLRSHRRPQCPQHQHQHRAIPLWPRAFFLRCSFLRARFSSWNGLFLRKADGSRNGGRYARSKRWGGYLGIGAILAVIFLGLGPVAAWIVSAIWAYGVFVLSGRLVRLGARWIARVGLRRVAGCVLVTLVLGVAAIYAIAAIFKKEVRQPIITDVVDYPSPDRKWVATLEAVNNGVYGDGFEPEPFYQEIHLRKPDEAIRAHGDDAKSSVFYIVALQKPNYRPQVRWLDSTHLVIRYSSAEVGSIEPGKLVQKLRGISISYERY